MADELKQQAFPYFRWGQYYVKYPCGEESKLMPCDIATEYAEIFGGQVIKAQPVYKRFATFGQFRRLIGYK